jgi:hypothetical protein
VTTDKFLLAPKVAHGLDGNELLWFFTRGKTSSGRSNWRERERERERRGGGGGGRRVPIIGADCTVADQNLSKGDKTNVNDSMYGHRKQGETQNVVLSVRVLKAKTQETETKIGRRENASQSELKFFLFYWKIGC